MPRLKRSDRGDRSRASGFTLIEFLVALTLFSLAMAVVVQMFIVGMRLYHMSKDIDAGMSSAEDALEGFPLQTGLLSQARLATKARGVTVAKLELTVAGVDYDFYLNGQKLMRKNLQTLASSEQADQVEAVRFKYFRKNNGVLVVTAVPAEVVAVGIEIDINMQHLEALITYATTAYLRNNH